MPIEHRTIQKSEINAPFPEKTLALALIACNGTMTVRGAMVMY